MTVKSPALLALAAVFAAVFALAPAPAQAQRGFPARPVRIIVPFPPGQATDIVARLLADGLTKAWGQQVIVENRGGGGGVPGMLAGRDAPADGYTVTLGTSGTIGVNPSLYSSLPYDPLKDFAMVNGVFIVPLMIIAHPSAPYAALKDLVDAAKKEPGKLNWGYPGSGTSQHLTGELFKFRVGVDIVGVPYKGSGPMLTDLLGGQITLAVDSLASALPQIRAGKVRAIAMTVAQRVPQLPEVPTVAELGYPGFDGAGWAGMVAPKATPHDVVEKIGADVRRQLADPAMRERIIERGAVPDARGPREFADFVTAEIAKWGEIVRRAKLKAD
ncbi:MAG TPA: tripartite tricarboxylate transporter substrate binding protein [Burkholderiales bacterium]|nr:tripartite tricarboxylate transporter substrate binding protein [Burkholderiales bacterium]